MLNYSSSLDKLSSSVLAKIKKINNILLQEKTR